MEPNTPLNVSELMNIAAERIKLSTLNAMLQLPFEVRIDLAFTDNQLEALIGSGLSEDDEMFLESLQQFDQKERIRYATMNDADVITELDRIRKRNDELQTRIDEIQETNDIKVITV